MGDTDVETVSKDIAVAAAEGESVVEEAEDDWEVECSDEELRSYTPPPETIVKLFTALANKEPLQLSWQCPPKRPLTPDVSESEEEDDAEPAAPASTNDDARNVGLQQVTEFDFSDPSPAAVNKNVKLRKSGSAKTLPLSAQKRSGQFQNVVKTVNRHSLEVKEQRLLARQQEQEQHMAALQAQHDLPGDGAAGHIISGQQQVFLQQPDLSGVAVAAPGNEGMEWTDTTGAIPNVQAALMEENLPADIDIDPDFQSLAIKSDGPAIEQYIAETQLDQIDPSDFALLSDLQEVAAPVPPHGVVGQGMPVPPGPPVPVAAWHVHTAGAPGHASGGPQSVMEGAPTGYYGPPHPQQQ